MTILLSEVIAARVLCKHPSCGAVSVFAVDNLSQAMPDGNCPRCGRPSLDLTAGHPLALLAAALRTVAAPETRGDIELVLGGPAGGLNPPPPPAVVVG